MAVAVDATGTVATSPTTGNTSITYTGITVGVGANRALIFMAYLQGGAAPPTGITAKWDNTGTPQTMTLIKSQAINTNEIVLLFGLRNPTSGLKTLLLSWTNGEAYSADAISFTGVDQVSDATAFPNSAVALNNSTAASITITSATNNIPVAVLGAGQALSAINQTTIFHDTSSVGECVGQRAVGAASINFTATVTPTGNWVYCGTDVAQVASADVLASQILL